jgi:hypothetical protein
MIPCVPDETGGTDDVSLIVRSEGLYLAEEADAEYRLQLGIGHMTLDQSDSRCCCWRCCNSAAS